MHSTAAPLTPAQIAARLAASRLSVGVQEAPAGPVVIAPAIRISSFGGFPAAPLATPALNPQAVLAAYALGD
jgi:hypothetical protein